MTGRRHAGTISVENNLYVFGGNQTSSSQSTLNSFEVADISNYLVSVQKEEKQVLNKYLLNQNYPNPFNPTTKISYQIPHTSKVKLKIYDSLGREMKELVNEFQSHGFYSIDYDASDFVSGIYFYQIQVNDWVSTKKMVLSR